MRRMLACVIFVGVANAAWPGGSAASAAPAIDGRISASAQILSAGWRDGEIRSESIAGTRETELSLGLLAAGRSGTLTLVLSARLTKTHPALPGTVQVRAAAGLNVNPNTIRRPVIRFVLDPGMEKTITIDVSNRVRVLDPEPASAVEDLFATISFTEFIQLLRADLITGQIIGLDFQLTSKQHEALRDFGMRVIQPSR